MEAFMKWMNDVVAPKADKVATNPWIMGLKRSIDCILPMILVGSLITLYNVIRNFVPDLPDLLNIRNYTFGLVGLFMAFLIPYFIMDAKKHANMRYVAGLSGLALFMMFVKPEVLEEGYLYQFSFFGAGGMFVSIVVGVCVAIVMNLFANFTFFKEDSTMPGFIQQWFNALIPIFLVVFVGWLLIFQFDFNMYQAIIDVFSPLVAIAQTLPGMLLLYLIPTIFYSMGISGWVFTPILDAIALTAITANAAAGADASNIFCNEVLYSVLMLGGRGCTLPLNIMALRAKSTRLKALSRASIVPSILNINEPIVFGAVAWNPMLMVPMWIVSIVTVVITFLSMSLGLVPIPTEVFSMWYCPVFLSGALVSGVAGVILTAVNFVIGWIGYYPFFKMYDNKLMQEEAEGYDEDDED